MPHPRFCVVLLSAALCGCGLFEDQSEDSKVEKLEVEGVKNVYKLSPRILTGGKPEGETGFSELEKLGVKTIVSVTDDAPDEEAAGKHGMRYVHVPMTYEGVSPEQREKILKAVSETTEPVFIHCNSGRNRGATAAAICLMGVEHESTEEAIARMKMRGVDEKHQELYRAVEDFEPDPEE
jgi:protein tyrosine phosphatase (PTP) superfamily phosphohydrolase (DUF442 family)